MKSWLFGPASRLDFVAKFQAAGAAAGVLDLEDATPESHKAEARAGLLAASADQLARGAMKLFVRANAVTTSHFVQDVAAAAGVGADGLVVPMLSEPDDVILARRSMAEAGMAGGLLLGGIESARGVVNANAICAAGVDYVYFGAEDYITDLGGRRTSSNAEVQVARSLVALAAGAARIGAVDQVVVDFGDLERFGREATEAADLGFCGKLCIHPSQVSVANKAFQPSPTEVAWAAGVVAAATAAADEGRGVTTYEGAMIDAPLIDRARRILTEADSDQPGSQASSGLGSD